MVNKSDATIKHAFSECYMCEAMHAISTSSTSNEYYKQQYCTMFIGCFFADVTISQKHLAAKQVEFSIAHISCSASCIELKLGTNYEGITQQSISLCIPMLGIF